MYTIDYEHPVRVHFIGIGGISMSGLAEILLGRQFPVTGSDLKASPLTDKLAALGAKIAIGHDAANIPEDCAAVVYTAAVHPDNPEYAEAVRRGIPLIARAVLLGQLMKNYPSAIAVAGTHGKTTTTSMIAEVLMAGEADPTILVGGVLSSIGGTTRVGTSPYFVAEACEYTNSFLSFFPNVAVILNVDADHLDFFKDLDDIASSFHRFASLVPEDGTLIIHASCNKFETVTEGLSCRIITFGDTENADYRAEDVTFDENGCASFRCIERGGDIGRFTLRVPGIHNVSNALAAIAAGRLAGVSPEKIAEGLSLFHGADRRFEMKGKIGSISIIDDYAHHPAEIRATLTAASRVAHHETWVAFQPHTYTRTKALLPEFADALSLADHVVLADIYAAREKNTVGVSSGDLAEALRKNGCDAVYLPDFSSIEDFLLTHAVDNDLIMTIGAGDIFRVGEHLLGKA